MWQPSLTCAEGATLSNHSHTRWHSREVPEGSRALTGAAHLAGSVRGLSPSYRATLTKVFLSGQFLSRELGAEGQG